MHACVSEACMAGQTESHSGSCMWTCDASKSKVLVPFTIEAPTCQLPMLSCCCCCCCCCCHSWFALLRMLAAAGGCCRGCGQQHSVLSLLPLLWCGRPAAFMPNCLAV